MRRDEVEVIKPDKDRLKPCPFCGNEEIVFTSYNHAAGIRWRVVCSNCMAGIDTGTIQQKWRLEDMWNKRMGSGINAR